MLSNIDLPLVLMAQALEQKPPFIFIHRRQTVAQKYTLIPSFPPLLSCQHVGAAVFLLCKYVPLFHLHVYDPTRDSFSSCNVSTNAEL